MKAARKSLKKICQNGLLFGRKNDISFWSAETRRNPALFRLFPGTDSDKESSHVVGKWSHSEE